MGGAVEHGSLYRGALLLIPWSAAPTVIRWVVLGLSLEYTRTI